MLLRLADKPNGTERYLDVGTGHLMLVSRNPLRLNWLHLHQLEGEDAKHVLSAIDAEVQAALEDWRPILTPEAMATPVVDAT